MQSEALLLAGKREVNPVIFLAWGQVGSYANSSILWIALSLFLGDKVYRRMEEGEP